MQDEYGGPKAVSTCMGNLPVDSIMLATGAVDRYFQDISRGLRFFDAFGVLRNSMRLLSLSVARICHRFLWFCFVVCICRVYLSRMYLFFRERERRVLVV